MKTYKKFILYFLLTLITTWLLYFSSVYFFFFDNIYDSFSINTYFKYKEKYAKSIKSKKIVFTSGSNNFLGIRSSKIESYFNIPSVNMSIHAGLGTSYILYRVKQILNKGDIVIVPLEYSNFIKNGGQSIVLNKYLLSYDREYFKKNLNLNEKLKCISSISIIDLLESVYDTHDSLQNKKRKYLLLKDLDKNGDMLNKTQHDNFKTKRPLFSLPSPVYLETKALIAIKNFNYWCKKGGIKFYITYPNIIYRKEYRNSKYQSYFSFLEKYFNKNGIKFIGKPLNMMYPRKYFYDSEYHLISKGSDIRTKDFIKELLKEKIIYKAKAYKSPQKHNVIKLETVK